MDMEKDLPQMQEDLSPDLTEEPADEAVAQTDPEAAEEEASSDFSECFERVEEEDYEYAGVDIYAEKEKSPVSKSTVVMVVVLIVAFILVILGFAFGPTLVQNVTDYFANRPVLVLSENDQYKLENTFMQKYDSISVYSDGLALVQKDGKEGYIDAEGKEVIPCEHPAGTFNVFSNGFATFKDATTGKYGFIDKTGKTAIPATFAAVGSFLESGMAPFMKDATSGLIGFINTKGETVVEAEWTGIIAADGEYITLQNKEKVAVINGEGKVILSIPAEQFDSAHRFSDGMLAFAVTKEITPATDTEKAVTETKYGFLSQALFVAGTNVEATWENVTDYNEGYASVLVDKKWGLIDKEGNMVIQPCSATAITYNEGVAVITKEVLDDEGKVAGTAVSKLCKADGTELFALEEGKTYNPGGFVNGSITVYDEEAKGYGLLDKEGKTVLACKYANAVAADENGYVVVQGTTGYGLLRLSDGKEILPLLYAQAPVMDEIGNIVIANDAGNFGLADKDGTVILAPTYPLVQYAGDGRYAVIESYEADNTTGEATYVMLYATVTKK